MRAESAVEPTRSENIRNLATLCTVFGRGARGAGRGRHVSGRRLAARISAQSSDSIEQLAAVPQRGNAKLLQVLSRQARKNRFVNLILAECSLVLSKAKAPQPNHDVHDEAQASPCTISSCERLGEGLQRRWVGREQQALRARKALLRPR